MKKINSTNINTEKYWDEHIAETDFGLRQKKYIELAGKGKLIAEFGCGLSPFLEEARKTFGTAYGIDFSKETIHQAGIKYPLVDYGRRDALKTGLPDKLFDVSVAGELIEHLEEPEKLIKEMVRTTSKRIVLSTAKMEYNDPEHLWEFTIEDLERMGGEYGQTKVEEIKSERFPGRSYLFLTIDL